MKNNKDIKVSSIKPHLLKAVLDWAEESDLTSSLIVMTGPLAELPESINDGEVKSFLINKKNAGFLDITDDGVFFTANIKNDGVTQVFIPTEYLICVRINETGSIFNLEFSEDLYGKIKWPEGLMSVSEIQRETKPKLRLVH